LQSDDVALLRKWAPKVAEAMQKLPELEEVETLGDEGLSMSRSIFIEKPHDV
jgi:multidrug efflux pump